MDLVIAGIAGPFSRTTKIYHNNTNGTFTEDTTAGSSLEGVENSSMAWGDYDNDGRLDLVVAGSPDGSNKSTKIYHNNSDGTFTQDTTADSNILDVNGCSVAWADYNNDGRLDLGITGYIGPNNWVTRNYLLY